MYVFLWTRSGDGFFESSVICVCETSTSSDRMVTLYRLFSVEFQHISLGTLLIDCGHMLQVVGPLGFLYRSRLIVAQRYECLVVV
jgi:hypothetical protein